MCHDDPCETALRPLAGYLQKLIKYIGEIDCWGVNPEQYLISILRLHGTVSTDLSHCTMGPSGTK